MEFLFGVGAESRERSQTLELWTDGLPFDLTTVFLSSNCNPLSTEPISFSLLYLTIGAYS